MKDSKRKSVIYERLVSALNIIGLVGIVVVIVWEISLLISWM